MYLIPNSPLPMKNIVGSWQFEYLISNGFCLRTVGLTHIGLHMPIFYSVTTCQTHNLLYTPGHAIPYFSPFFSKSIQCCCPIRNNLDSKWLSPEHSIGYTNRTRLIRLYPSCWCWTDICLTRHRCINSMYVFRNDVCTTKELVKQV